MRSYSKPVLPELPYDYGELEPVISGKIMELHHSKHHATYVNNVNNAITQLEEAEAKGDAAKVASLQQAFRFNGMYTILLCQKPLFMGQCSVPSCALLLTPSLSLASSSLSSLHLSF